MFRTSTNSIKKNTLIKMLLLYYFILKIIYILFLLVFKVFLASFWIWFHSGISFVPVSWANFTVFSNKLKSFNSSESFVNVSANWKIVDGLRLNNTLVVDNEHTSQSDSHIRTNSIVFGDRFIQIG